MLQFGSGPRCGIETTETEAEAVAGFAAACLRNGAELPLLLAHTAELSRDRLSELLNGEAAASPAAPERPRVPLRGLENALKAYWQGEASAKRGERMMRDAEEQLQTFFDHYDIEVNFQ